MRSLNAVKKLAAAVLLLLFLFYIGYQVAQNLSVQIKTVDALVVTVEDKIFAEGIFLRSQQSVSGENTGYMEYLAENGEKVSVGQELAIFFDSASAAEDYRRLRAAQDRLDGLEYAYSSLSGGTDTLKLDSMIYSRMSSVAKQLDTGRLNSIGGAYSTLQQLIVGRSAGLSNLDSYREKIRQTEDEIERLRGEMSKSSSSVRAAVSGYFIRSSDGAAAAYTPADIDELTPADIRAVSDEPVRSDAIGVIVDNYEWYFAAAVTQEQADALKKLKSTDVYFLEIGSDKLKMSIEDVRTYGGEAVVILKSREMKEDYLSSRHQNADMVLGTYSGIKVPREALRSLDGKWGVYCLEGAMIKFKPIEWVYQTESYYLAVPASSPSKGLYMYDKVVISAKDIEHNKVVK
ncbi:MAG: hypothetical protein IJU78_06385 [Clostridia bacterium]|nr:hypothetical protein [Clostridia bacterium]